MQSVAVLGPDDQLGQHRIVVDGHVEALVDARCPGARPAPGARSGRRCGRCWARSCGPGPRRRGGTPWPSRAARRSSWRQQRPSPWAISDHGPHQVGAGDHLGDRVLDLQAGVHLQEVEVAVGGQDELDRAGAAVVDRARRSAPPPRRCSARSSGVSEGEGLSSITFWWRRCTEHSRSKTWMTLPRAVAQHLHLDVLGVLDVLLDEDRVVAEAGAGLAPGLAQGARPSRRPLRTTRMPLPPPPAEAFSSTG